MTPLQRLRHHVTGAIERGEAVAIKEKRPMITTQREARAEFWRQFPGVKRKPGLSHNDYPADTRVTFVDWIEYMHRSGQMSDRLVKTVTLGDY